MVGLGGKVGRVGRAVGGLGGGLVVGRGRADSEHPEVDVARVVGGGLGVVLGRVGLVGGATVGEMV